MLRGIIEEIKSGLSTLPFADLVAGLAKTVVRNVNTADGRVLPKRFPVYENDQKGACSTGDYVDLVPNTNRESILYFQDLGNTQVNQDGRYTYMESRVRCVCWVNLKKINANYTDTDLIQNVLMSSIPTTVTYPGVCKVNITSLSPVVKDATIFSGFDYSEAENQYLMYPYDYFAFDFVIQWAFPYNCRNLIKDPSPCK